MKTCIFIWELSWIRFYMGCITSVWRKVKLNNSTWRANKRIILWRNSKICINNRCGWLQLKLICRNIIKVYGPVNSFCLKNREWSVFESYLSVNSGNYCIFNFAGIYSNFSASCCRFYVAFCFAVFEFKITGCSCTVQSFEWLIFNSKAGTCTDQLNVFKFDPLGLENDLTLNSPGRHKMRSGAEEHMYNPATIHLVQTYSLLKKLPNKLYPFLDPFGQRE